MDGNKESEDHKCKVQFIIIPALISIICETKLQKQWKQVVNCVWTDSTIDLPTSGQLWEVAAVQDRPTVFLSSTNRNQYTQALFSYTFQTSHVEFHQSLINMCAEYTGVHAQCYL